MSERDPFNNRLELAEAVCNAWREYDLADTHANWRQRNNVEVAWRAWFDFQGIKEGI